MFEHETTLNLFDYRNILLLDPKEVAAILKVAVKTVHKLSREGKLACVQITPRERRFTWEQLQQYIDSRSTHVVVDKKCSRPVSSSPKKGGEKSSRVINRADLLKEIRSWQ